LIKDKAISAKPIKHKKIKKKRRRKGVGKRKKTVNKRKREYVYLIRKLRKYLKSLKDKKEITSKEHIHIRKLAKSGHFRSKRHLQEYMKTRKK